MLCQSSRVFFDYGRLLVLGSLCFFQLHGASTGKPVAVTFYTVTLSVVVSSSVCALSDLCFICVTAPVRLKFARKRSHTFKLTQQGDPGAEEENVKGDLAETRSWRNAEELQAAHDQVCE